MVHGPCRPVPVPPCPVPRVTLFELGQSTAPEVTRRPPQSLSQHLPAPSVWCWTAENDNEPPRRRQCRPRDTASGGPQEDGWRSIDDSEAPTSYNLSLELLLLLQQCGSGDPTKLLHFPGKECKNAGTGGAVAEARYLGR